MRVIDCAERSRRRSSARRFRWIIGGTNDDKIVPHELPIEFRTILRDKTLLSVRIVSNRQVDFSLCGEPQRRASPDDESVEQYAGFVFERKSELLQQAGAVDAGRGRDCNRSVMRPTAQGDDQRNDDQPTRRRRNSRQHFNRA